MKETDKRKKRAYASPRLTAVTFRTERGYANSGIDPLVQQLNIWICEDGMIAQDQQNHVEVYEVNSNWTQGSNHFWD